MKTYLLFLLSILSLGVTIQAQDTKLTIPFLAKVNIDGKAKEWKDIPSHYYQSDSKTNLKVTGKLAKGDLKADIKLAWNETGLFVYVQWEDNVWDEQTITKEQSIIRLKSGRRMDKMYLYDHLKIQIRALDNNYTSWFAPRLKALQWQSLRQRKYRKNVTLPVAEPQYVMQKQTTKKGKEKWVLEVQYQWKDLKINPRLKNLQVLVMINDADTPKANQGQRLKTARKFITLNRKATLGQ
ncbi:MAG TPA: hypothetical protein DCS93_02905 [Microscillaceae bacterium]|nr:hypothetical protein [Microscillaceae bacterium]